MKKIFSAPNVVPCALSVTEVHSSFFADRQRFPEGSIQFDHALIMRDILHEWHKAEDLYTVA